jgi:hypothetical protein
MEREKYPNVAHVRLQARQQWEKQARKRISIQERIGQSISWWLVLIALVFFLLSAPHTARIFGMLTPTLGYIAPVGVEMGLLYTAFRRKKAHSLKERVPKGDWALQILLFITAIIVNGAGSFVAVVDSTSEIKDLSLSMLISQFGTLPATSQVALVLVPLAALIIPIGTGVAGEGMAALFLERRQTGDLMEENWRLVSADIEFMALRDAAIANGVSPLKAIKWAAQIVNMDRPQVSVVSARPQVSAADSQRTAERTLLIGGPDNGGHGTGQGYTKQMNARDKARLYLEENPDAVDMSVRDLAARIGIGKTVAGEEMAAFRARTNGNGHYPSENGNSEV